MASYVSMWIAGQNQRIFKFAKNMRFIDIRVWTIDSESPFFEALEDGVNIA